MVTRGERTEKPLIVNPGAGAVTEEVLKRADEGSPAGKVSRPGLRPRR
jgi:hypothetical protein